MKQKKNALFQSVIALILCVSMLMGTTFAWFTDAVTTGLNTIAAGVLDVELYHSNAAVTEEQVEVNTNLFMDLNGNPILWEPGVVSYENLRIANAGDLALAYQLAINTANENFVVEESGAQYGLSQILKVGVVEGGITATDRAGVVASVEEGNWTTLASFVRSGSLLPEGEGESEKTWGVVIYWEPGENDNYWNLNNGKQLNEGEVLMIDLGIKLIATQEVYESDSFGSDYDAAAKLDVFPVFVAPGSTTTTVVPNDQNQVASGLEMSAGQVSASIPAGVQLAAGTTELTMSVSEMDQSGANISLGVNEAMRSLDVHIEGVAEDNTVPMTITLKEIAPVGLNMGNYKLYHVENGTTVEMTLVDPAEAFTAHNQFKYNPATGDVTLYMATFSEVAVVAEPPKWEGNFDYSWYTNANASEYIISNADQLAGFGAIVGGMNGQTQDSFKGKSVKLISDINIGDSEEQNNPDVIFYPIGYYNTDGTYDKTQKKIESYFNPFEGTFDGNGHTISNIYQNTWEMFGDYNDGYSGTPNHYRDGMGLFGKVYGGTVKNLTIRNFKSDGEFTTTGCVAAYADGATFENISIFDCNPRVYNIGNGGIVGCVGWYAKEAGLKTTLENITVDNSNKISALWGSYDVACGGLVGQYYPTSGQTSAGTPKNAGIHMENCHVAAQMDVYNDVCGNYQYYAYRYAGMMIGSIRENTTTVIDGVTKTIPDMTGITAKGCTVNYGDWNDYYYCEFVKNGHPSYSGPDDYKFSRVPDSELNFTDSNGNGKVDANERSSVEGCKHEHTEAEDNQAIYLPFHQLFTGYGWGVNSIGLKEYSGIVTDLGITEGEQEESVEKFVGKENINLSTVKAGDSVNISALFASANSGVEIKNENVMVSVTDLTNNGITADFTRGATWDQGSLKFNGTNGIVQITIQDYYFCNPTSITLTVGEFNTTDRFKLQFPNTAKYLYRVGNMNEINISSLFGLEDGVNAADIGEVNVVVTNMAGNELSVYTAGTGAWDSGEIDFDNEFTGPVKITISDDNFSTPLTLNVEVVKAQNYTSQPAVTAHNAVLLNNVSGSFTVYNGYTLYGNGFTVTLPTNHQASYTAGFVGYITVNNGNMDNVQIEGPVYPEMNIYQSQAQNSTTNKEEYFYNSVLINGGNCTISNSYISGSRTTVCIRGGNNVVIENTTLAGGAVANMQIAGANTVLLRNLTTVQEDETDSYGKGVTAHGMGVYVDSSVAEITIEGYLNQYNWLSYEQWADIVGDYESAFPDFYHESTYEAYQHTRNNETYVNMAFIFACDWNKDKLNVDKQTNSGLYQKLDGVKIQTYTGGVYSVANQGSVSDEMYSAPDHESTGFNPVAPVFAFDNIPNHDADDEADATDSYCVYDKDSGIISIGLKSEDVTLDLSGASVVKDGTSLEYTVYLNDVQITGNSVTVKATDGTKQTLKFKTILNNKGYDPDGSEISGSEEYVWVLILDVATLSFPGPVWNIDGYTSGTTTYTVDTTNCYYVYYQSTTGYGEAVPIYDGIKVNYYDKNGVLVEKDFSTVQAELKGKGETLSLNTPITYETDGCKLTMTVTGAFKSGVTGLYFTTYNNKTYVYPADLKSDSYVRPSKTGYDFNVSVKYIFTDPNGLSTEEITMNWYGAKANGKNVNDVQWKKFDGDNGQEAPSCVTGDTLITLADGTQKRIDSLTGNEQLLVWDFYKGEYAASPVGAVINHGYSNVNEVTMRFADGTTIETIGGHGFFDVAANKFVIIDENNIEDYIGHEFVKYDAIGNSINTVLVDYSVKTEYTEAWTIVSAIHFDCILNDMLTLSPTDFANSPAYLMPFEIGEGMKYDEAKMQADIEKYGLYTYEDFAEYCTYEQFEGFAFANWKVAVGKGYIAFDDIIYLIDTYVNN